MNFPIEVGILDGTAWNVDQNDLDRILDLECYRSEEWEYHHSSKTLAHKCYLGINLSNVIVSVSVPRKQNKNNTSISRNLRPWFVVKVFMIRNALRNNSQQRYKTQNRPWMSEDRNSIWNIWQNVAWHTLQSWHDPRATRYATLDGLWVVRWEREVLEIWEIVVEEEAHQGCLGSRFSLGSYCLQFFHPWVFFCRLCEGTNYWLRPMRKERRRMRPQKQKISW
jgi:hypothetical protein